jgi:hypothetical protein
MHFARYFCTMSKKPVGLLSGQLQFSHVSMKA